MNRKTVAIIGTRGYPSYYGGFETAVRKLAPYLADHGWDVTVYSRPGQTKEDDPDRDQRVKVVYTKGFDTRSLSTLSYGYSAFRDAVRKRPDVLLVMNVANGFFLRMAKRRKIPTVINVDGMEWKRAKWGKLAKAVFHRGAVLTARYATSLVADSAEIGRQWKEEFRVDSEFIPYGGDVPDKMPAPLGLGAGSYILLVARFVPENTIEPFFEAVEELAKNHPVVLVGRDGIDGELDHKAQELSVSFENVHWLGQVEDDELLYALWQNCGVYFHGHSVGGTNPALVQAMACGIPIVARESPFTREVLGKWALYTSSDSKEIGHQIERLISDSRLRKSLSAGVKARAMDSYSWQSVCKRYESVLENQTKPESDLK
jgi:glycosyltransferase involved in cell wall biosynthesis